MTPKFVGRNLQAREEDQDPSDVRAEVPEIISSRSIDMEQHPVSQWSRQAGAALSEGDTEADGKFDDIDLVKALSPPNQKRVWAPRSRSLPRSWFNDESDDGRPSMHA